MIGQTIFHYMILEHLGEGGRGAVYEAQTASAFQHNNTIDIRRLRLLKSEEQMRVSRLSICCAAVMLWALMAGAQERAKVSDVLQHVTRVEIPLFGYPVERTVAEGIRKTFVPAAAVVEVPDREPIRKGSLRIHVSPVGSDASPGWFRLQLSPDGGGRNVGVTYLPALCCVLPHPRRMVR